MVGWASKMTLWHKNQSIQTDLNLRGFLHVKHILKDTCYRNQEFKIIKYPVNGLRKDFYKGNRVVVVAIAYFREETTNR